MIALAVIYLVGACAIFAVVWRECDKADQAEAEMERRMEESARELDWRMARFRSGLSDPGNDREKPRRIP